ncbi:hypothetical protein IQ238_14030 [Pleurocapsales cyanobacterium LEGE 06147]|nr:hypothetical protein [Pleurocapsales cyanobacterium LEGE 06147]
MCSSRAKSKSIFYFLTEQWDEYENLDFEHTFLQTAFEHGSEQLRQRIREQIRKAGRAELLKVLAGGNHKKRLGAMTDAEWETTLAVLNSTQQWEEMWRLAQKAPAIWSKQLLQQLKQAAWLPKEEQERVGFERLKQLAQKCLEKIPPIGGLTSCQATLTGHTDLVGGVIFSPDGRLLASCSADTTIRLWQMPDGKPLATLTGHTDSVGGVTFSPDGRLLASSSEDTTIRLWMLRLWKLDLPRLNGLPIGQLSQQDREFIQKVLLNEELTEEEQHWLEFMQELSNWHRRFDVEVEDAPRLVSTGEFDIEIEG